MNYLKRGLHNTLNSIKKHKVLFLLIILLQIIFVVSSLWLGSLYLLKILENTQGIIGPLENANYDSQKIEQGEAFTPDYAAIYNSYQSMLKNVIIFAAGMAALFLLLNGSIWLLSHWVLQEKRSWKLRFKESLQFLLKAWASIFILFGPFKIISYYVLLHFIRISQSFSNVALVLKILLIASLVIYYFLLVALAAAPILSWKQFAKMWVHASVTQFRKTVVLFLSIMLALFVSLAALYWAIEYEKSAALLLWLGMACIVMIGVIRIFWIATIQEIEHETSHH